MRKRTAPASPWFATVLLVLGSAGCAALWIMLAAATARQSSWMAVVAALDAALLLRMARVSPGAARALWGVLATAAAIVLANWFIAAAQLGRMFGLLPWDSALKLGAGHAWNLAQLANDPVELAWLGAGLAVAAVASR
ncbi:hypothetical protein QFW77_03945 [Luteimonas sp. RD2P54]|uniref:Uncharacterized protein n=1 Tax=Luteimonas endophytica TaxID=3042023 RepID=A0ABT6J5R0_9GAMM|nr:hypothetical protein [Luteimonas endophytica]MDH5822141.1 hypothetical protein [Luteimonas endophytica]